MRQIFAEGVPTGLTFARALAVARGIAPLGRPYIFLPALARPVHFRPA